MTTTDYQKGVCQCRSCSSIFHQSEVVRIQTEHNGLERICPKCGSHTYGVIEYPVTEEELIYKSGKFYGLSHKREEYIEVYENDEYIREVIDQLYV